MDLASPMASAVYLYRINYRFKHQSRGAAYHRARWHAPASRHKGREKALFFPVASRFARLELHAEPLSVERHRSLARNNLNVFAPQPPAPHRHSLSDLH